MSVKAATSGAVLRSEMTPDTEARLISGTIPICLQSITNCGVLITCGAASGIDAAARAEQPGDDNAPGTVRTARYLVDGIFGETEYFSPLPKSMKKACFGMGEEYRDIDHLLFTHRHLDHFHAGFVKSYVRNNRVSTVIVPSAGDDPLSCLEDRGSMEAVGTSCRLEEPSLSFREKLGFTLPGGPFHATAEYICCRHLDWKTYAAVQHCALVLTVGSCQAAVQDEAPALTVMNSGTKESRRDVSAVRKLVFFADAAPTDENRELLTQAGEPDAAFVTPLFYLDPRGRKILREIDPKRTFLYHLPFPEDDGTGLWELAEKLRKEHTEDGTLAIFAPGETAII